MSASQKTTDQTEYTVFDGSGQPRAIYTADSADAALDQYRVESPVVFDDAFAEPTTEQDYRRFGIKDFA